MPLKYFHNNDAGLKKRENNHEQDGEIPQRSSL